MSSRFKWIFTDQPSADFLSKLPGYSGIVGRLLCERGLNTKEKIDKFFKPEYSQGTHDPFLLKDMKLAGERIERAVENKEKIVIYSDYDVDGVCSATVLGEFFKLVDYPFSVYLPDRQKEGHGLNQLALESLVSSGAGLIITLDCGTTNLKEVSWAKEKGVDVIVVDHHQVIDQKPTAYAFINPHQEGDNYPFKGLCGTGLAFKMYCALIESFNYGSPPSHEAMEGKKKWLLDLVALATVADMVPLLDENRIFVKYGLIVLAQTRRLGLKKLMESSGIKASYDLETLSTNLDTMTLGFSIGPRINAASRMAHANLAYDLLNSLDETKLDELASSLNENNRRRQQSADKILKQLVEVVLKKETIPWFIVEGLADWPLTLVGLVASRVAEKFYRPVLIFEKKIDGTCKGSLRSVEGLDVVKALASVSEYLIQYGGHPAAAGCTFKVENEEVIREKLNEYAKSVLTPELLQKKLKIDAEVSLGEINWNLMDILKKFEPFGMGNFKPKFITKGVEVKNLVLLGQNSEHLKIFVADPALDGKGGVFPLLFFRHNGLAEDFKISDTLDIVYELDINEWNGNRGIQLKLIDYNKRVNQE